MQRYTRQSRRPLTVVQKTKKKQLRKISVEFWIETMSGLYADWVYLFYLDLKSYSNTFQLYDSGQHLGGRKPGKALRETPKPP